MAALGTIITGAAALAGIAGLAMLIAGLRGRRIDDHPVCRRCRFDLVGLYPGAAACPECGRALSARAVRIGQRRRRKGVATCGALLLGVVLGFGTFVGVSAARGFNWNPYKPTWLLISQAPAGSRPVLDELAARVAAGRVGRAGAQRIVSEAQRAQTGLLTPGGGAMADLVGPLWAQGLVDDERALAFLRGAGPIDVRVLRQGPTGRGVYLVSINAALLRCGSSRELALDFVLVGADVEGRPIEIEDPPTITTATPAPAGLTNGFGSQLPIFDPTRGTLQTRWSVTATSRAGPRAGETLGAWEVVVETPVPQAPSVPTR